jgi:hypothetical protein
LVALGIAVGAFLLLGGDEPTSTTTAAGPGAISVPDVVRQTEEDARAMLEREGFEVEATLVTGSGEEGLVLSQDPSAGTEGDEGSTVTLEISRSPIDALLRMVPSGIRSSCNEEQSDDFPDSAIAKARCILDQGVAVQYNLFADESGLTQAFDDSLEGVEQDLGRSIPEGSCATDRFAMGTYTVDGADAGSVFCYVSEGDSWIEWMDSSLLVYSFAFREGGRNDLLYRWWTRSSGPVVPRE